MDFFSPIQKQKLNQPKFKKAHYTSNLHRGSNNACPSSSELCLLSNTPIPRVLAREAKTPLSHRSSERLTGLQRRASDSYFMFQPFDRKHAYEGLFHLTTG